jgi:hypothetical protein
MAELSFAFKIPPGRTKANHPAAVKADNEIEPI